MKKWLIVLTVLFAISSVSAQLYLGSYAPPSDWLNNPYVVFALFFALFFAAIYFALGKSMQGNVVIPAVISAVLAFVISAGVQQSWTVMQRPIMFWAMILAGVLIIGILILAFTKFGGTKAGIAIVSGLYALWPIIRSSMSADTLARMPVELVNFLNNTWWIGLIIAIIALFAIGYGMRMVWRHRFVRV